jgi:hypothetical protein
MRARRIGSRSPHGLSGEDCAGGDPFAAMVRFGDLQLLGLQLTHVWSFAIPASLLAAKEWWENLFLGTGLHSRPLVSHRLQTGRRLSPVQVIR